MSRRRWPGSVYDDGDEPDYRFSLANERTFLAWLRTGLALVAAGVAVEVVDLALDEGATRALATMLLGLGAGCAALAWVRWAGSERAMRREEPLPPLGVAAVGLAGTLLVLSLGVMLLAGLR